MNPYKLAEGIVVFGETAASEEVRVLAECIVSLAHRFSESLGHPVLETDKTLTEAVFDYSLLWIKNHKGCNQ